MNRSILGEKVQIGSVASLVEVAPAGSLDQGWPLERLAPLWRLSKVGSLLRTTSIQFGHKDEGPPDEVFLDAHDGRFLGCL